MNEVKNAPVLIVTKATETLDTLIALKNVIQCNAIKSPVKINLMIPGLSIRKLFLKSKKYRAMNIEAKNIRYQTKGIASIEMSLPNMAVNPQMNTIK